METLTPVRAAESPASTESRAAEPPSAIAADALLYEARLHISSTIEYGASLARVLGGTAAMPPEGIRCDFDFRGTVTGPALNGTAIGVDYVYVRADGRIELHIHARITTSDGANIALFGDGAGMLAKDGLVELREAVRFHASDPRYHWVNRLPAWGKGTVDLSRGEIIVRAFAA